MIVNKKVRPGCERLRLDEWDYILRNDFKGSHEKSLLFQELFRSCEFSLTERQRLVLKMMFRDGLTVSEISKTLGVTAGVVTRIRDKGSKKMGEGLIYIAYSKTTEGGSK